MQRIIVKGKNTPKVEQQPESQPVVKSAMSKVADAVGEKFVRKAVDVVINTGISTPSSEEVIKAREAICLGCEFHFFENKALRCNKCGCHMKQKFRLDGNKCPIGKW